MQYGTKGLLGPNFTDIEEKYDLTEAQDGFGEEGEDADASDLETDDELSADDEEEDAHASDEEDESDEDAGGMFDDSSEAY